MATLKKWEYLIESGYGKNDSDLMELLDEKGELGWELVLQLQSGPLVFKRPLTREK